MSYIPKVGERVEIFDNGWRTTHTTPRWAYRYKGEVIRLNDLSITVMLDDFDGMRIRVDYDDVKPEGMTDVEARKKIKEWMNNEESGTDRNDSERYGEEANQDQGDY